MRDIAEECEPPGGLRERRPCSTITSTSELSGDGQECPSYGRLCASAEESRCSHPPVGWLRLLLQPESTGSTSTTRPGFRVLPALSSAELEAFTCQRGFPTEQQSQSSEQTAGSGIGFRETQVAQQPRPPIIVGNHLRVTQIKLGHPAENSTPINPLRLVHGSMRGAS